MLTFGSLFSGAGLLDLGLERAGLRCVWQCEIDPHARRVLAKYWPMTPCHEDVRQVGKHNLESVDVVVGGFPCQDLSLAGRRAGIQSGQRSSLFWELLRVIGELRPRLVLWENVPGLLSSDGGRDLRRICFALAEHDYFGCIRTLDARYFGVPQRRRRLFGVFVRDDPTAGSAAEILAVTEGGGGHSAPRRQAGQETARTAGGRPAGPGVSGRGRGDGDDLIVAHALTGGQRRGHDGLIVAPTLTGRQRGGKSHGRRSDCAHALRGPSAGATSDARPLLLAPDPVVRRLTPVECSRLMGLPDSWLDLDPPVSDSVKYRLCGNGVVVNVARWLGSCLAAFLKEQERSQ